MGNLFGKKTYYYFSNPEVDEAYRIFENDQYRRKVLGNNLVNQEVHKARQIKREAVQPIHYSGLAQLYGTASASNGRISTSKRSSSKRSVIPVGYFELMEQQPNDPFGY